MDEIQFIVERLNAEPFRMKLRLVDFDEKTPMELLQVLNDVFGHMDSNMNRDVRDEPEEQRCRR